jgi:hypothetical protein
MVHKNSWSTVLAIVSVLQVGDAAWSTEDENRPGGVTGNGAVVKAVVRPEHPGENVLKPENWQPFEEGFQRQGNEFLCDNGANSRQEMGTIGQLQHGHARLAASAGGNLPRSAGQGAHL